MWWWNELIDLINKFNSISSIIDAVKTIVKVFIWIKHHKDDIKNYIVNACLKIFDLFDFKKKNLHFNKLMKIKTPFWEYSGYKDTIIWI